MGEAGSTEGEAGAAAGVLPPAVEASTSTASSDGAFLERSAKLEYILPRASLLGG